MTNSVNDPIEFSLENTDVTSSPVQLHGADVSGHQPIEDGTQSPASPEPPEPKENEAEAVISGGIGHLEAERSPAFKELAAPRLPRLEGENRAWLQMQTPNRLYFYWSLKRNPYHTLNRVLNRSLNHASVANAGNYTLALRLLDLQNDAEEIHAVGAEGSWWFNVSANRSYRAEIGFFAPNRPFIRIIFSNVVHTPRKSPSPRMATAADWRVPSPQFVKVLEAAGFRRDAFDVAMTGDDVYRAWDAAFLAISRLTGRPPEIFFGLDPEDIRFALLAIASGAVLEDLRSRISGRLFALLQESVERLTRENALQALKAEYDIEAEDLQPEEMLEEYPQPAVFGASLVHFPKRFRRLRTLPVSRFPGGGPFAPGIEGQPVSSHIHSASGMPQIF